MKNLRLWMLCAFFFACAACATAAPPVTDAASHVIAFVHANVIPMDRERVLGDQTVVVSNGTIVAVGPASAVKVPPHALRVDAAGRYLLPALCDMHVHIEGEAWNMMLRPEDRRPTKDIPFEKILFPYVANGVTTVQVLSATPDEVPLRARINRGEVLGPRLILAPMIDGPKKAWPPPISVWVDSPAEAREAVLKAKAIGYDKIKVYSFLSRESYDAIVATAREVKMDVIGHVPMSVSVEYVIDSGQKLIAHTEEIAKHAGGDYRPERIDYFAALIANRGVWITPTLVTTRAILAVFDDAGAVLGRPEAVYHNDPLQTGIWSFVAEKLYGPIPAAPRKKIRDDFEQFQRPLTKAIHDKGGRVMTGSDTILPGLVAGFSLHGELRELVDVGFTPYEALRASTTTPFEYLGENDKGTIESGKHSDLILVEKNPLEDVSAASKISGVLIRGRWVDKNEIDKKMREIAKSQQPRRIVSQ